MKWVFFKTEKKQSNMEQYMERSKMEALQVIATADLNLECAKRILTHCNLTFQKDITEIEKTRKHIHALIEKIENSPAPAKK